MLTVADRTMAARESTRRHPLLLATPAIHHDDDALLTEETSGLTIASIGADITHVGHTGYRCRTWQEATYRVARYLHLTEDGHPDQEATTRLRTAIRYLDLTTRIALADGLLTVVTPTGTGVRAACTTDREGTTILIGSRTRAGLGTLTVTDNVLDAAVAVTYHISR